jgi:hypothetical protein
VSKQKDSEAAAEAPKKAARKPRAPKTKVEPVIASKPEEVKPVEVEAPKPIPSEKTKIILKKPFDWQKSIAYTGSVVSHIRGSLEDLVRKKNIKRF